MNIANIYRDRTLDMLSEENVGAFVILCACHALDGLSIAESED